MAKVTSLLGGLRGKASNMVFAKTGGSVIMREYNPTVSNPNTEAQVGNRTQFKLMSQLAAAMSDVIAIPKQGLVSARNRFMSLNYQYCYYEGNTAQCTYENLQLTDGTVALPGIFASRADADNHYIQLREAAPETIDRVVYAVFKKSNENLLQLTLSAVVGIPGDDRKFKLSGIELEGEVVIFAYGMRDLNAKARASYANYSVENGVDIATLVANRSISSTDYKFTATRGTTLAADEDESESLAPNQARVYATATSGGSVSGAGVYTIGSNATLVATPASGFLFSKWVVNGDATGTPVSTSASYTFEVTGQVDLVAIFVENPDEGNE